MKKSFMLWITIFVIAGSILTACAGNNSDVLSGNWKLISYGSLTDPTPAAPNVETSLTFGTDGKLSGSVGCNSFGGDYKVDGNTITFGALASTEMACAEPLMQQESAVFNLLSNSAAFQVDGNTLTITSTDGISVVVFARN